MSRGDPYYQFYKNAPSVETFFRMSARKCGLLTLRTGKTLIAGENKMSWIWRNCTLHSKPILFKPCSEGNDLGELYIATPPDSSHDRHLRMQQNWDLVRTLIHLGHWHPLFYKQSCNESLCQSRYNVHKKNETLVGCHASTCVPRPVTKCTNKLVKKCANVRNSKMVRVINSHWNWKGHLGRV